MDIMIADSKFSRKQTIVILWIGTLSGILTMKN